MWASRCSALGAPPQQRPASVSTGEIQQTNNYTECVSGVNNNYQLTWVTTEIKPDHAPGPRLCAAAHHLRQRLSPSLPAFRAPKLGAVLSSQGSPVTGGASTVSPALQLGKGRQEPECCLCRDGTCTGTQLTHVYTGTHR